MCALLRDLLSQGLDVRVRVSGASMKPFLRGGEALTIRRVAASAVRVGDIVLVDRGGAGDPRIHRVVSVGAKDGARQITTKGDGLVAGDGVTTARDLLGRVVSIERGPRARDTQNLDGRGAILLGAVQARVSVARGLAIRVRGKLKRLAGRARGRKG